MSPMLVGGSGDPGEGKLLAAGTVPMLQLDQLLRQLIDRAEDVLVVQDRLRGLLQANQVIVSELGLPVLLRHIVEAACELIQARYGALGVINPTGVGLDEFIHVGIDTETAARIGHLPQGKGLLGALIEDPRPIRLTDIADDHRSVGFPAHHPEMRSFLGVPIRVRGRVFGNLYLAERIGGDFTEEDVQLATSLAATAGVAIDNARLLEESQYRQRWLTASTEITRLLLSEEGEEPLQAIARTVHEIGDADVVTVVLPTPDGARLMVEVAVGEGADQLTGITYPVENSLVGLAITTGRPAMIGDVSQQHDYVMHLTQAMSVGPVMVLPMVASERVRGALSVGRRVGRRPFSDADLDIATTFANHAAVALELADGRQQEQRMAVLEDRDRIARDLHDHVIQRLFAAGLTVQSVASALGGAAPSDRLDRVVNDIDDTIRQIRTSIFQLRGSIGPQGTPVRRRLLAVADDVAGTLGFQPQLQFSGPVDSVVSPELLDDVLAVVREALTNTARHAGASEAVVRVVAGDSDFAVTVADDGGGLGDTVRRSGLANLLARAVRRGGRLELSVPDGGGTELTWSVPLT